MWETVPRLLAENRYLVLGTADAEGRPWATPVFFAADGEHRVYWVSSPDSRHSHNISARPAVAITIFDSRAPVGGAEAVYLEATARPVSGDAVAEGVDLLNTRLSASERLGPENIAPAGPMQVYQATITQHFVLIRGRDPRFSNVVDARLAVTPPLPSEPRRRAHHADRPAGRSPASRPG